MKGPTPGTTCLGLRCFAGVPQVPMAFLCNGCAAKLEPADWSMIASAYAFGPASVPFKVAQAIIVAWLEWEPGRWTEDQLFAWLRKALEAISDESGPIPYPEYCWVQSRLGPDMADVLDIPF